MIVAFPCTTILLTNSASSLRILGTLNGVATTFSGIGRALGPAAAGAVFSWGVQRGYIIAAWWFLGIIALIGTIPPWFIVEDDRGHESSGTSRSTSVLGGEEREELLNDGDDDDEVIEAVHDGESSGSDEERRSRKRKGEGRSYGTMRAETRST